MNHVTKDIDYPIMEVTISPHFALNYNVIERTSGEYPVFYAIFRKSQETVH